MFGLKGILRAWGPGLVLVSGDFTVASSAIATPRPSRPGFTVTRSAAGVYVVTLSQAFASVVMAEAVVGPDTGSTGSLPTSNPVDPPQISQGFLTSNSGGTAFAADSTGTKLLILVTSSGALADVPSNHRLSFGILLAESQVNR